MQQERKTVLCLRHFLVALIFCFIPRLVFAQTVGSPVNGSLENFNKPNQNRVFYHDSTWWLAARAVDKDWYLWRFNGASWEQGILIDTSSKSRPDCYVDSQNNQLYIAVSNPSESKFVRASYTGGNWSIDSGFPVVVSNFTHQGDDVFSMAVDRAGGIWLFRIAVAVLEGIHSDDGGATWGPVIPIKSNLNAQSGLTDAVAFKINGQDYLGVAYAENTMSGVISMFGFLHHKIGEPETGWSDETDMMGQFSGTKADNHIAAIADAKGDVYFVMKTGGGKNSAAANGLYKRDANGWQRFDVNIGSGWTRPAISVDETNNELYVFGTYESVPQIGVYKKVFIGNESSLLTANEVTIFENASDRFKNLSVAAHHVDQHTGLMVVVENDTQEAIWFNRIDIVRVNRAPVAIATATPVAGTAPLPVRFNGSVSNDPDGSIASYAWDFGDNSGSSSQADPQYTYTTANTFLARLIVTDNEGKSDTASVTITVDSTTSDVADTRDGRAPVAFNLFEAYPNPLSRQALVAGKRINIRISLPAIQKVTVRIYNALGQLVSSLAEDLTLAPNFYIYTWDGRNTAGRLVPTGVYFVQVHAGAANATRKVMILR